MSRVALVSCSSFLLLSSLAGWASAQSSFVNWESPHVHPLDLTPDGTKLLAVNLPDNRLEVFDVQSGKAVARFSVPTGLDPTSVRARTNTEAWVVNRVSDSVSVVDLVTRNVIATLVTDDEPADVVFAGTPERAFVSCSQTDRVLVFDPTNLAAAPAVVRIQGKHPRAVATSPARDEVYVTLVASGNGTTVLGGGVAEAVKLPFPPTVVSDPAGPWGGQNPPPNMELGFSPPIAAGLPLPPRVGLIVRQDANGNWKDDNDGDWTALVSGPQAALSGRPVGWTLLDHDVAVIDAASLAVSYVDRLMNIDMALAVAPTSGTIAVVGTEATNEIRYVQNLSGRFVRSKLAFVDPLLPGAPAVVDLNTHLTYTTPAVPQSERDRTLADPRGVVWNAAGTRLYVAGLGSNNVIALDAGGMRVGIAPTIEVGEGPTGLALDEARQRLYVMNKHDASISVVDTVFELEIARVPFHDPTPQAIRVGRKHQYDARETSGLGLTACASCHIDARMDLLAWDLGDPQGAMKSPMEQNLGANLVNLRGGFEDWHPMKGPMTTQTLQDIIGHEPHHWRGDRDGIEQFNDAFQSLLGDDEQLTPAEMQEFEDFLATITFPPNRFRNLDNTLPTSVSLPGLFTTGRFGPAGQPLPDGDAARGLQLYLPPFLNFGEGLPCATCHTLPTGIGPDMTFVNNTNYVSIPPGPMGQRHHALMSVDGQTNRTMKVPQLRNLREKMGFDCMQMVNTRGFGYLQDGSIDSLSRFLTEPVFVFTSDQDVADMIAFLFSYSGSDLPAGSVTNMLVPPGTPSRDTHAAVGVQVTLSGEDPGPVVAARLTQMLQQADLGKVGLVVKGRLVGFQRGWTYVGGNQFQSDRQSKIYSRANLQALAGSGQELTFTVVPLGSQVRIGVDRDLDGFFDRDELDAGSDPADPASVPGKFKGKVLPVLPQQMIVSASLSRASAFPVSGVIANGIDTSTITVVVRDPYGNPLAGQTVELAANGSGNTTVQPEPTNAAGVAMGLIASTVAETKTITVTVKRGPTKVVLLDRPTVGFVADAENLSASLSTASASPASGVIANGIDSSTITVVVRDAYGNPVAGQTVDLAASGSGNTIAQPGATNASGTATGTIASTVAETKTITATVNPGPAEVVLGEQPVITFVP